MPLVCICNITFGGQGVGYSCAVGDTAYEIAEKLALKLSINSYEFTYMGTYNVDYKEFFEADKECDTVKTEWSDRIPWDKQVEIIKAQLKLLIEADVPPGTDIKGTVDNSPYAVVAYNGDYDDYKYCLYKFPNKNYDFLGDSFKKWKVDYLGYKNYKEIPLIYVSDC